MYFYVFLAFLVANGQCAKILGVFMYPSISHQIIYQTISKELSLRGHQVTVVTPNPLNDPSLTNLTEISVSFVYDVMKKNHVQQQYSKEMDAFEVMKNIYRLTNTVVDLELNSTQFRELILDQTQNFDLVLIHYLNPVMFGLGARFKAPIISIASLNAYAANYDAVGNPNHPLLYPDFHFLFRPEALTLYDKFKSLYFFIRSKFYHHLVSVPSAHTIATKYLGDIPYLGDLEKSVSMLFVYRHVLMEPSKPQVPAVLDFSFINTKPSEPLPDDLQKILDDAINGVIYISFGTNIKPELFVKTLKDSILEALPELPYTILLKWNSGDFSVKSSNVIVRRWYPQRDLLAHPNVKVFVFQGGLQSIEETILGEVPVVGIPFITDQPKNIRRLVELGIGEEIDSRTISKDEFKNTIIKVAEDVSYKERIKAVRKTLLDKSMTGLESAVWWCEYVIRHRGAKHLRSSTVNASYSEYLLLDMVLFLLIFIVLIVFSLSLICKLYIKKICQRNNRVQ